MIANLIGINDRGFLIYIQKVELAMALMLNTPSQIVPKQTLTYFMELSGDIHPPDHIKVTVKA